MPIHALQFREFAKSTGHMNEPAKVVSYDEITLPGLAPDAVRVRMLAAPINPSDINILQGVYGELPGLPAIGGKEGVGVVEEVGGEVEDIKVGDHVAADAEQGSWREELVMPAAGVTRFPKGLSTAQMATLYVNPSTAYRMLVDVIDLEPGDWVVQNGANSAVGRCVIEIAKQMGFRTLNLVRRADERRAELKALGADVVIEDNKSAHKAVAVAAEGQPVKLGLDCVGGDSAGRLNRVLAEGGRHVVYGAMSKQGTLAGAGSLIFKNVRVRGYWVTRWYRSASRSAVEDMWGDLAKMMRNGKLSPAVEKTYRLSEYEAAIEHATQPGRSGKILFACSEGALD